MGHDTPGRGVTVVTVLRSGGAYAPEHVQALYRSVAGWWPAGHPRRNLVLTDQPVGADGVEECALVHAWPGWWSKLELFRPDLLSWGPMLFLDLDTRAVGLWDQIAAVRDLTTLSDFYRPAKVASGFMHLPAEVREEVWVRWMEGPEGHMRRFRGDQDFLGMVWAHTSVQRWQDVVPGQVVSYKVHVQPAGGRVAKNVRVVCFHGHPRPWQVAW